MFALDTAHLWSLLVNFKASVTQYDRIFRNSKGQDTPTPIEALSWE
jgi:hypothetical protein